jgi:starch synthase (maltosyl-transferring)
MGPRVYNLFPTLAGPIAHWHGHLERIAAMGFDWIYLNPIHATGGSGSLYAVADYGRLNPALRGDDARSDDAILRDFIGAARERGIRVMLDLVINHTANDSPLVAAHPDWYVRGDDGRPAAPFAVDPDDPEKVTTWGDLAELDFSERPARAEIVDFFAGIVRHYAGLGARGFRCDAAYKVPGAVWSQIVAAARDVAPDTLFAAETLGCRPEEVAQLGCAGFDYLFNSSKWWDFRESWLLEQYERFRHIAPSIAFPESHDTPRLAAELNGRSDAEIEAEYRFRYLFAAFFSSGVMMPMGYEYGFARKLDVVATTPADWEEPRFDLSSFIADANAMKAATPALNEEGAERLLAREGGAVALLRSGGSPGDAALAVLNPDARASAELDARTLVAALDGVPRDVTPHAAEKHPVVPEERVRLDPLEIRVFTRGDAAGRPSQELPSSSREPAAPAFRRVAVIENVTPQLDGGRHPIKRIVGDRIAVEADVFREGHDALAAVLLYRERGAARWREAPLEPLEPLDDDRWGGSFRVDRNAEYEYTVEAWPDEFATWRRDVAKKRAAGQSLEIEIEEGRALLQSAAARASGDERARLEAFAREAELDALLGDEAATLAAGAPDRSQATRYEPVLRAIVDRPRAQAGAWYELFPRSLGAPGTHGTFRDAEARLQDVRAMGFDIVYLPPIHPIGRAFRKGRNNAAEAADGDPGSPWAIGNEHGGHTAIEPALGTLDDFERFVAKARGLGLEVALDYALQASPDHPFVREHPEWFAFRSDGTIKYAENPPKKYQDIVNFNWFGPEAPALWEALRDVVLFWIARGVRVFRVDNPHTKPFAFWEWMLADVRARHPETIFLAEAFTRPAVMKQLAKLGFTQSYTYFTWRTTKAELTEYASELAHSGMAEYFRPNFWPNTPDILHPYLQTGGRPAFRIRLILAATLASNYGIYSGYELCENAALPGREEYANSEKYELVARDWNAPGNIVDDIARINRIRREHAALADWRNLTFYRADDDAVIFYGKRAGDEVLLIAVNLDPFAAHDPLLWLPTGELGFADDEPYAVEELLGETRHEWVGSAHRWRLDPGSNPAAIFRLRASARA